MVGGRAGGHPKASTRAAQPHHGTPRSAGRASVVRLSNKALSVGFSDWGREDGSMRQPPNQKGAQWSTTHKSPICTTRHCQPTFLDCNFLACREDLGYPCVLQALEHGTLVYWTVDQQKPLELDSRPAGLAPA